MIYGIPSKRDLKLLIASRSWAFVRNSRPERLGSEVATYQWHGNVIRYRPGTSDAHIIHQVLLRKRVPVDYDIPIQIKPHGILDIGGHIGCAALYLASRYSHAVIYSFEPIPENFKLLQQNVAGHPNIHAFNVALGDKDASIKMRAANPHNWLASPLIELGTTVRQNATYRCAEHRAI